MLIRQNVWRTALSRLVPPKPDARQRATADWIAIVEHIKFLKLEAKSRQ
jgi:hypothetical protein